MKAELIDIREQIVAMLSEAVESAGVPSRISAAWPKSFHGNLLTYQEIENASAGPMKSRIGYQVDIWCSSLSGCMALARALVEIFGGAGFSWSAGPEQETEQYVRKIMRFSAAVDRIHFRLIDG